MAVSDDVALCINDKSLSDGPIAVRVQSHIIQPIEDVVIKRRSLRVVRRVGRQVAL